MKAKKPAEVFSPSDYIRKEIVRLNQQIVDRDTTIMLEGERIERLRVVADAARSFSALVWTGAPTDKYDAAHDALERALAALD